MNTKERLIQDIKESIEEAARLLARGELSNTAISTLAGQLNQANNMAQALKALSGLA